MRMLAALLLTGLIASTAWAQRSILPDRHGVPEWTNPPEFADDVFTFVRLKPRHHRSALTDYPDSDLNFSYRLQQLTSLRTNPNPIILSPDSPELPNYPFLYLVETGRRMQLDEDEVQALRKYLLNGGFLLIDDFWGEAEWRTTYAELKKIFPDREPVELEISHEIFRTVFEMKEKPQVPSIDYALKGRAEGKIWERDDAKGAHYYGIFDDKNRMVVFICRNTDLGDGWEREGESQWYFQEFSEKKSYPMGVNIVVYALTH